MIATTFTINAESFGIGILVGAALLVLIVVACDLLFGPRL
jgi:hypothetical protein